jgi:hypothetical protein
LQWACNFSFGLEILDTHAGLDHVRMEPDRVSHCPSLAACRARDLNFGPFGLGQDVIYPIRVQFVFMPGHSIYISFDLIN